MTRLSRPLLPAVVLLAGLPMLAGCSSSGGFSSPFEFSFAATPAAPPPPPVVPPSVRGEEIVGSWGFSSYHREQDRARTEKDARGQCSTRPYPIEASASGGVRMYGHDNPQMQEMTLKGSAEGKTYLGPGRDPAGGDDREVVSFDGRVLVLKWVDPEVAGRYGTMVLVRCGIDAAPARTARAKTKSAAVPQ